MQSRCYYKHMSNDIHTLRNQMSKKSMQLALASSESEKARIREEIKAIAERLNRV